MDWESLFKRYVWDDNKTPYLVPVSKLNRRQANSEIMIFSLFLGVLFGVVAVASLSAKAPHGYSPNMALYGFTVVCAAVCFGVAKSYVAALYLSATPLAGLAYVLLYGFGSERELLDTVIVATVLVLLLRYSRRIVSVARAYPGLPEGPDDDTPRRGLFK